MKILVNFGLKKIAAIEGNEKIYTQNGFVDVTPSELPEFPPILTENSNTATNATKTRRTKPTHEGLPGDRPSRGRKPGSGKRKIQQHVHKS